MSIQVLIVEDESLIRWSLRQKFEERDYMVLEAETGGGALKLLAENAIDLIILDYQLPDTTGLDILRSLRKSNHDAVVVMMTAHSTIKMAVDAVKLGAFDFVPKPFQMDELMFTVDKALETTRLRREVTELRRQLHKEFGTDTIIGQHASIKSLMEMLQQIAAAGGSTVLIRGETGTGKDLVARVIHQTSPRADAPFVNITCTALSDMLLESELFGHERGAFTDAKALKKGLLEVAAGGTVFLDEIGDMPANLQAKLLRFLEERRFRRVGGNKEIEVDVRVIAATNCKMEDAIREGRFREDLFYRLNVVSLELPPIRARGEDVVLLAQHFVERFAREFKKTLTGISDAGLAKLRAHTWPGNVRELRNAVERAVLLAKGKMLGADDFVIGAVGGTAVDGGLASFELPPEGFDLQQLNDLEVRILRQAMERSRNNQVHAAQLLNLTRDRLRYRLLKYGLI